MRLGDIIYYFTKFTGIKFIVYLFNRIFKKDCGCDDRRKKLNNIKRW
jgi:hypothetical protein